VTHEVDSMEYNVDSGGAIICAQRMLSLSVMLYAWDPPYVHYTNLGLCHVSVTHQQSSLQNTQKKRTEEKHLSSMYELILFLLCHAG
jgi:hypothetical protein